MLWLLATVEALPELSNAIVQSALYKALETVSAAIGTVSETRYKFP